MPLLNEQQKQVYETLMQAVENNTGGLFFLDAPGGTGKTFVISLILATIRSRCDIALALASSGIAATLLDGGRTAHSALELPLNLNTIDTPTCNISRSSAMGKLLMQCKLIVWDECTMTLRKSLEALNFTLKDLHLLHLLITKRNVTYKTKPSVVETEFAGFASFFIKMNNNQEKYYAPYWSPWNIHTLRNLVVQQSFLM